MILPNRGGNFLFELSTPASPAFEYVADHVKALPAVSIPLPCHTSPLFTPLRRIVAPPLVLKPPPPCIPVGRWGALLVSPLIEVLRCATGEKLSLINLPS